MADEGDKIYPLVTSQPKPDPFFAYSETMHKLKIPLIIDNGSHSCKAGWAKDDKPLLVFKNHVAKHRGKKENEVQVGNDIQNIEMVRWLLKTQFDKNVVTQFDVQETIFDHIFNRLRINTPFCVDHPIVLTEATCNPSYSRQFMSELLFECYQVPQVAYGIDSLFSFSYNNTKQKAQNGLVVSLEHNSVHVLPVLNGRLDVHQAKRINIGGQQMMAFLHRLLHLKYPVHASAISLSRVENLLHSHSKFSCNYSEEIKLWSKEDYYEKEVHKIQLPYIPLPGCASDSRKLENCHTLLTRVQAIRMKQRDEKLAYDEERLQELLSVQELLEDEDEEAILALQELGYSTAAELQAGIKKLNCNIRKTKNLILMQQEEPHDSPLQEWCEELNPVHFSDSDAWIIAVTQKRKELFESRQKLSSDEMKSLEFGGFSSTTANDLFGGVFGESGGLLSFQEYANELEEMKEQIKIVDEILAEYKRELANKSQKNISFNLAEYYQVHLGVEQIRVPEIIFQPSTIGIEQAGVAESIEMVLSSYSAKNQQTLAENIFITGGCAKIPFIKERLEAEILAVRPFKSEFNVSIAADPLLDAWKGARQWSLTGDNMRKFSISRADYEEKGSDYLKEHSCSNYYVPAPVRKVTSNPDVAVQSSFS